MNELMINVTKGHAQLNYNEIFKLFFKNIYDFRGTFFSRDVLGKFKRFFMIFIILLFEFSISIIYSPCSK